VHGDGEHLVLQPSLRRCCVEEDKADKQRRDQTQSNLRIEVKKHTPVLLENAICDFAHLLGEWSCKSLTKIDIVLLCIRSSGIVEALENETINCSTSLLVFWTDPAVDIVQDQSSLVLLDIDVIADVLPAEDGVLKQFRKSAHRMRPQCSKVSHEAATFMSR
jgi:hypothetical protein